MEIKETKTCRICKKDLPCTEEYFMPRLFKRGLGWHGECRQCNNIQKMENYRTPRGRLVQLIRMARNRALKKGIPFSLTLEDFPDGIPKTCPILGTPLQIKGKLKAGGTANAPSLDRIDPSGGYTKDNVAIVSHRANTLKNDMKLTEAVKIADYLLAWEKKKRGKK